MRPQTTVMTGDRAVAVLARKLRRLLEVDGVSLDGDDLRRLAFQIDRSTRLRATARRRWSKARLAHEDIIRLALEARDSGDEDEAFWRVFLAAHLGRESADKDVDGQVESAARLLCGFGGKPRWTWAVVRRDPQAFRRWLLAHKHDLRGLSFGNHRKYESKRPHRLWAVVGSFMSLAEQFGDGPAAVFDAGDVDGAEERFDLLYQRLRALHHFGRTGRFDFISLLSDLELVRASPSGCYLQGATGPLRGARLIWGKRPVRELDALAARLARKMSISPCSVEDALCNWQKGL